MKTLQVTNEWLNKFHEERIELITTIDNRELLTKRVNGDLKGNQLDYATFFRLIETFFNALFFLKMDSIRLVWSEKLDNDGLQFFRKEDSFEIWKKNVLDGNYEFENSFGGIMKIRPRFIITIPYMRKMEITLCINMIKRIEPLSIFGIIQILIQLIFPSI